MLLIGQTEIGKTFIAPEATGHRPARLCISVLYMTVTARRERGARPIERNVSAVPRQTGQTLTS